MRPSIMYIIYKQSIKQTKKKKINKAKVAAGGGECTTFFWPQNGSHVDKKLAAWKSSFRFFSWTERPFDSKLARKHQGDL